MSKKNKEYVDKYIKKVANLSNEKIWVEINNYLLAGVEVDPPEKDAKKADLVQWLREVAEDLEALPIVLTEENVEEFEGKTPGDIVLVEFADYEDMQNEGEGAEVAERKKAAESDEKKEDEKKDDNEDKKPAQDENEPQNEVVEDSIEQKLRQAVKDSKLEYDGRKVLAIRNRIVAGRRVFELDCGAVAFTVTDDQAKELI